MTYLAPLPFLPPTMAAAMTASQNHAPLPHGAGTVPPQDRRGLHPMQSAIVMPPY